MHSGAWEEASFELFAISEKLGESEDVLAFAEKQFPGFADFAQPVSFELTKLRLHALIALFHTESFDALRQRLAHLDYVLSELLTDGGGPVWRAKTLALRGETQAAIDVALTEIFSKPAIWYVDIDRTFDLQLMAEVAADPRIQQALARWQDEKEEATEEVRDYLAGIETI